MMVLIGPAGQVRCLYGEAIDLAALGPLSIARGSHVEPNCRGQWFADMSPVDGPRLGPFRRRSEALRAEVAWLEEHWLLPAPSRDTQSQSGQTLSKVPIIS